MRHWQTVRNSWKRAYAVNEGRYKRSMGALKGMFDRDVQVPYTP